MNNIDYESLRKDLINYFGSATPIYGISYLYVAKIKYATNRELETIAEDNGFDLSDYEIYERRR